MSEPHQTRNMKKIIKKKAKLPKDVIEFDNAQISLILEALREQITRLREEQFYRAKHPDAFYDIYVRRFYELIEKLDRKLPRHIFIKMPKF